MVNTDKNIAGLAKGVWPGKTEKKAALTGSA
jgi:hypothetical protein